MSRQSVAESSLPVCPDCRSPLPYVSINVVKPFECPFCGKKLVVRPEYSDDIRRVCTVLAMALSIVFVFHWKNLYLFLLTPIIFAFLAIIAQIFWKRIVPPEIEDYDSPRYVAL
jgi:hypothetical protein